MDRARLAEAQYRKEQDAPKSEVDTNRESTSDLPGNQLPESRDEEDFATDDLLGNYEESD